MKKVVFLIIVLFTTQMSKAQIEVGPKAGLAVYQLVSGGNDGFRTGLYFGGFADFEINPKFNFQTDLGYVQKGSAEDGRINKIDYFQFAPKAKFFTGKIKENEGFYITAGLGLNFLMKDELEIDDEVVIESLGFKSFDLSLLLGFGFELQNNVSIEFNVIDAGITKPIDIDNTSFRNLGGNITLSYGFNVTNKKD